MTTRRTGVDLNRTWEVGLDRAAFLELSREGSFHAILALCRLVNMLRFATFAVYGLEASKSPFARRQSMISFSFSCALLYEAHTYIVPSLGKYFKSVQVYREGVGAWASNREVRDFVHVNCKPFRHSTVFHVLTDTIGSRLAAIDSRWTRMFSSRGTMNGFYYYDLADLVALSAFLGENAPTPRAEIKRLASQATKLTKAFLKGADDLIRSVIASPPYRLKQGRDTREPAWITFQQRRDRVVPPEERPPHFSKPV